MSLLYHSNSQVVKIERFIYIGRTQLIMTKHKVEISGAGIVDKHTHYEVHPFIGPERATIIIRGDIATDFQKKYGLPIP